MALLLPSSLFLSSIEKKNHKEKDFVWWVTQALCRWLSCGEARKGQKGKKSGIRNKKNIMGENYLQYNLFNCNILKIF